jgi:hypothetical protein
MTKFKFHLILALNSAFILAAMLSFLLPPDYSEKLSLAFEEETSTLFMDLTWWAIVAMAGFVVAAIAGFIGMFFFKAWARSLSLYTTVLGIFLYPSLGPSLSSGLEAAIHEAASTIWGATLALAYYSPFSGYFSANNSFKADA